MTAKDTVEAAIKEHKVVIFSKSYCPYCNSTKKTLSKDDPYILELDEIDEGDEIQSYLQSKTGQRTVPSIFLAGRHIGGNSDLQRLSRKQIDEQINA